MLRYLETDAKVYFNNTINFWSFA